jgi:hypothetical protein
MKALICAALMCQFSVLCQDSQPKYLLLSPPDGGPGIRLTASSIQRNLSGGSYITRH